MWATAAALGPVAGGALTNNVSWRWCFYINRELPLVDWLLDLWVFIIY